MSDALIAWSSDSFPSVAETRVKSTCSNSYGSAPLRRTRARSCASPVSPMPVISAEPPAMPSGF